MSINGISNFAITVSFAILVWTAAAVGAVVASVVYYAFCMALYEGGALAIVLGTIPMIAFLLVAVGLFLSVIAYGWEVLTEK